MHSGRVIKTKKENEKLTRDSSKRLMTNATHTKNPNLEKQIFQVLSTNESGKKCRRVID